MPYAFSTYVLIKQFTIFILSWLRKDFEFWISLFFKSRFQHKDCIDKAHLVLFLIGKFANLIVSGIRFRSIHVTTTKAP